MMPPKPPPDLAVAQFKQAQMIDEIAFFFAKMTIGHGAALLGLTLVVQPQTFGKPHRGRQP